MTVKDRYGVVLVGCGTVAGYGHLPAIVGSEKVRLIGVVDKQPAKASAYQERFGAESWSTEYQAYLNRDDVDIVVITTWPSSHAEIAIESMKAGKHVLTEKPISNSLDSAKRMIAVAGECKRKLMVGYILRHNEAYKKVAEMIRNGAIGRPIILRMLGGEDVPTGQAWSRDLDIIKDTSPLIDCGVHYADIMRWYTGSEASYVSGVGISLRPDVPKNNYNYAQISVKMEDGSVGIYEVGWDPTIRNFSEKEFIGPKGRIRLRYGRVEEGKEVIQTIEYFTPDSGIEILQIHSPIKHMDDQLSNFLEGIERDVDQASSLEDAMRSLEIVLAGHQAILTGETIRITKTYPNWDTEYPDCILAVNPDQVP